jgi:biofilm protein TabA
MIQDRMKNTSLYAPLGDNFVEAFRFMESLKPDELSEGRVDVKGDEIFALVQRYDTIEPAKAFYETHRRYADIQLVLAGRERMDYHVIDGLEERTPYNPEKDAAFFEPCPGSQLVLEAGDFAVFFPDDAHAPKIAVDGPEAVLKVVIKVAL